MEAGDRVPADLRLLEVHGLMAQEAVLTGESVPVEKSTRAVAADAALGDRAGMAYSGTLITAGQARGLVVATGTATEIGRISGLLGEVEPLVTPLVRQMNRFGRWLSGGILTLALLILVFGYFVQHLPFGELFMAVVGLSVAAIPEGLPAILTVTLAIGVQAMARRNAIIRRLPAIETVGAVSVICSDKTGTLTSNEMMVATVVTGAGRHLRVTGSGYAPEGRVERDGEAVNASEVAGLVDLARVAWLCNDAELRQDDGQWNVEGDPMEGALVALARKLDIRTLDNDGPWVRTDLIPFDAQHRFMATLNHDHQGHAGVFLKGAPEAVLDRCRWQLNADGEHEVLDRGWWERKQEEIARGGERVLALAVRPEAPEKTVLVFEDVADELILVGLVGLIDPPRPEAIAAVGECHKAGIAVKMITGDHALTASAIARQVGLTRAESVLTGKDLDALDDAQLAEAVRENDVFARTSPEHKLRLVMALQSHGLAVAMTGDGVNDAPALKRADIGIAMGRKGSEATREAADLVLADDNFASIVAAVREGRTVYTNLKKVIGWTLPTNAGEALTIMVALSVGFTLPINPVQILWVNLVTGITLGVALAFEPMEDATMARPPRRRNEPLLTPAILWTIVTASSLFLAAVYGIFLHAKAQGYPIELARTMAVNTLVVMEIFYLFFMRNFYTTSINRKAIRGTPVVWLTVGLVVAAQFVMTYAPPAQRLFDTRAVPLVDGLLIVGSGVVVFGLLEVEKQVRLRRQGRKAVAGVSAAQ